MKDHDTFGSQDPYCVVTVGSTKKQTKAMDGAGKKPKWTGFTFKFRTQNRTKASIKVDVYDKDAVSSDDLVGSGVIAGRNIQQFNQIVTNGPIVQVPLYYKQKSAGTCQVRVYFVPDPRP